MIDRSMKSDNYESKKKTGKFSWVRKLIQSKGNRTEKGSKSKSTEPVIGASSTTAVVAETAPIPILTTDYTESITETNTTATIKSSNASLKPSNIAQGSLLSKPDNISALPVTSISTMSIRSSTFSMNSYQSTSPTMASEHPTLFTNASTMGIAPASIFDRMERRNRRVRGGINSNLYLTSNNTSNHTLASVNSELSIQTPHAEVSAT